jgi:hypothetical protein
MSSRPVLKATQPPIQWVPSTLSSGVKRPGREADHSPPASVEVKKTWLYTSTPPYVFMTLPDNVLRMRRLSLFLVNNNLSSSWFSLELFRCRAFVSRIRYYSKGGAQYPEQNGRNWQLRWNSRHSAVVPLFLCKNDCCNSLAFWLNYFVSFPVNNS